MNDDRTSETGELDSLLLARPRNSVGFYLLPDHDREQRDAGLETAWGATLGAPGVLGGYSGEVLDRRERHVKGPAPQRS
ncbi:hypothetical protein [Nocardioides sp.]|uniref:hypothetical protein n=1 Tax=Nocardioides sp. TaxID=35761 RepID=UPI003529870C